MAKKEIEENRTTSFGLLIYADEYFHAYHTLVMSKEHRWPKQVLAFLFCHGVELSLKSFLRNKGVSVNNLIGKYGHDLNKLVDECKHQGIDDYHIFTDEDWAKISALNQLYKNKEFEYIVSGIKPFPASIDETFTHFTKFVHDITQMCQQTNRKERE